MPVKIRPVGWIFRILEFGPLEAKTRKMRIQNADCLSPDLLDFSLLFSISLLFSFARNSLFFLIVFPLFPRNFRASEERKNPCFLDGFPCLFQKKPGKEDQDLVTRKVGV